ncbi:MAG: carboxypeptidase regulatory-like domain-containing protein [Eubacterium sp.]|nr:carboxypeptidase regulatory-like domain-containing protein [Eubacterium sp.]
MKKIISKAFSVLFAVMMCLSLLFGGGSSISVRAAGENKTLLEVADNVTLDYIINKSDGDKQVYPNTNPGTNPTVTYGDTLYVSLSWSFADNTKLIPNVELTYTLPSIIKFRDLKSEITNPAGKVLGDFVLENNVIKITYTDEDFCKENKRKGSLTFSGSIKDNGQGKQPEQDITIKFPDKVKVTFHMKPSDTNSEVALKKQIWHVSPEDVPADTPAADRNYIYRSRIRITSYGVNSNIKFNDEMWPGMTLYSTPVFYSDINLSKELDSSEFQLTYTNGGNTISAIIPSMSSEEQMWVSYLVKVDPAMYDMDTATEFLKTADPRHQYYDNGFKGKVSNKAEASSDEAPKQVRSWGDVGTIGGSIDKWSSPEKHQFDKGLMHWEIVIKSIIDKDYTSGYIIDKLPKNMSLVKENTFIRDVDTYNIIENGIDIKETKNSDGTTDVRFDFSDDVITLLKKKESSQAVITYDTKIEKQDVPALRYDNTATIYFDGNKLMDVSAADTFKKPNDLSKEGNYDRTTAPYVEFEVEANPAALDLDPDTDTLTLEDTLCEHYDLIVDSLKINGEKPLEGVLKYDNSSRKFTLSLKDGVAYKITYKARVNLKKGEHLSGSNEVSLFSKHPNGYNTKTGNEIESEVFQSAASSSSELETGVLNVIKNEKGDNAKILKGAKFSLTTMDGTSTVKKQSEDDKGVIEITGANGIAAFGDLKRGVVFMLKEEEAPSNYKKDDTIRFYAFSDPKVDFGSTVTYEGKQYALTLVPLERDSYNVYIENEKLPEKGSIKLTKTIDGPVKDNDLKNLKFVVNDGSTDVWTGTLGDTSKFTKGTDGNYVAVIGGLDTSKTYKVTESVKDIDGTTVTVTYEIGEGATKTGDSASGIEVKKDETTEVTFHDVYKEDTPLGSLKLTKTIEGDVNENDLTNLTFKVKASDGTVVFEGTLGQFTLEDGKYVKTFSDLDTTKTYSVTESLFDVDGTTVTVKYSINGGAETSESSVSGISLTKDETTTVAFRDIYTEDTTEKTTDVYITKVEITNGPEIEGATLVVTKDTKDGDVVESWISGKVDGETGPHKINLSSGTYVLTETLVPDDFHLQAESITFTVNDDGTVTVNSEAAANNTVVMIDDVAGALKITVEEESGTKVPDAVVTITTMKPDGTTETKEYTTDKDGQIYIPNLPVGNDYSYKVTKVPDGYVVTTTGEETGVVIKAKEVTEKLEKIKKEQKTTEQITTEATTTEEPTTFTTEEQTTTETTTEATTEATTKKQTTTTEDPDDVDPDDEDPEEDRGNIVITILDEKTRKPVPNATVTVERPDGTKGTYTTDENGQIILRDVPTGDYKITVDQVPAGYTVTTGKTQTITVEKDKTTSHTALVTDSTTQATTQTTQTPGGSNPSNNTAQRTSVKTGDDAKVVLIMLIMSISIIYILSWCILRYQKRKDDK